MLEVVRKDWRAARPFLAPAVFVFAVFLTVGVERPAAMLAIGILLTLGAFAALLWLDELNRIEPLLAAMPLTRRAVVAGRFASAGAAALAGLLLTFGAAAVLQALPIRTAIAPGSIITLPAALEFLAGVAVPAALFLPFYFAFGLSRALPRFVLFLAVAGMVSAAAAGVVLAASGVRTAGFLEAPFVLAARGLLRVRSLGGTPAVAAVIAAAVAALCLLSFRLSVRLYGRRDF